MKTLLSIMLSGLCFTCVASLAMPSFPAPVPGQSCIASYPAASDPGSINFCGCYAGSSESICNDLHQPGCSNYSPVLAGQACMQASREGGVANFCNNEHSQDPTDVITANCIADMTIVCGNSAAGTGICNPCWTSGTCYTVGS